MSYDIGLQKIIDGDSGLCTPEEANACVKLLKSITSDKPDEFNFLLLEFEDGSTVEVSIWADEKAISGCTFFTRGISDSLVDFIFQLAAAGNFVILDTGGNDTVDSPIAILTSKTLLSTIGQDVFENPRICESSSELSEILGISSDEWSEYRDHVVESRSNKSRGDTLPKQSFFKRLFSLKK